MTWATRQAQARFFAVALGRPTPETHRLLRRPGLRAILADLAGPDAELPARLLVPRDRQRLETEHLAAFEVGAPHAPVPLIESHWVRHRPANQIIAENARFYRAFGMALQPGHETPDHLVCQLAFVEYLLWAAVEREAREADATPFRWALGDFVRLHLVSWVPPATAVAVGRRLPPLYTALLAALRGWIRSLAAELPAADAAAVSEP